MLKQKTFIKKTKKGAILKVVREHYLRDDIYCGLPSCAECPNEASVEAGLTVGPLLTKDFPPRLEGVHFAALLQGHQVQVSFYKPSLLGSRWSKSLEFFFIVAN